MWSRRQFIFKSVFSTLGSYALLNEHSALAFGKKIKQIAMYPEPILLSGEYWSPPIACDFIITFGPDLCCILDEFGRLATANILPAAQHSHVFPILGRLNNLGTKVLDFQLIEPRLAIALVWNENKNKVDEHNKLDEHSKPGEHKENNKFHSGESNLQDWPDWQAGSFALTVINLTTPSAPFIVSTIDLPHTYLQLPSFTIAKGIICLGGVNSKGENFVALYRLVGKKKNKTQNLASFTLAKPIKDIIFGNNQLLITHDTSESFVSVIDITNISRPKFIRTLTLPGVAIKIICFQNTFVTARKEDAKCVVDIGDLKTFPHAKQTVNIDALNSIESLTMNNQHLLILGSHGESVVVPCLIERDYNLRVQNLINFKRRTKDTYIASKIILGKNNAFVSCGWEGVQVLSLSPNGSWTASAHYSVPKLPVACLITWSNYLLLASTDLRLYDLSHPEEAKLLTVAKLPLALKAMTNIDDYVLCLDKTGITLRHIENPQNILTNLKLTAEQLSYDPKTKKAYLLQELPASKKQKAHKQLTQLNALNNNLSINKTIEVDNDAYCLSAYGGYILVGNLAGLSLYKTGEDKAVCQHSFPDLAWRQILLTEQNIFATAIDHNANGFFLIMSFNEEGINLLSSIKIPHDGVALAINKNTAITIGQNEEGSSLLALIDLKNLGEPKILSIKTTIDSASAITMSQDLAIACGRGFEIFSIH